MARVFHDGFECGGDSVNKIPVLWEATDVQYFSVTHKDDLSDYDPSLTAPPKGDFCLLVWGNRGFTEYIEIDLQPYMALGNELYFKWRYQPTYAPSSNEKFAFYNSDGQRLAYIELNKTKKLDVYVTGASVGNGATVLTLYQWHQIEFYLKIDGTDGAYELKVNGTSDVSASGIDTQYYSNSNIRYFRVLANSGINTKYDLVDDFVVDDSDWPGDGWIIALRPNAAGSLGLWSHVNKGADTQAYQAVDDAPADDDDYIYDESVGAEHSFHIEDPPPSDSMSTIKGVSVVVRGKKTGIPDVNNLELFLYHSGNQALSGEDKELEFSYKGFLYLWEERPSSLGLGTGAWTKSNLTNLQIGVKGKA